MLRKKSLLIVIATSIAVFFLLVFTLKVVIEEDYELLEVELSKQHYRFITQDFLTMYRDLNRLVRDWAEWDDTYKFLIDYPRGNESYIKSNLPTNILDNLSVDFVIYLDDQNRVIYQVSNGIDINDISYIIGKLNFYQDLTGMTTNPYKDMVIFSSHSITDSEARLTPIGTLIMGYFFDDDRKEELENKVGFNFDIIGITGNLEKNYEVKIEDEVVYNRFYLKTLKKRAVIVEYSRTADILHLGYVTYLHYTYMLILHFLILVVAIYFFIDRAIIKKLTCVELTVVEIISKRDLKKRIGVKGRDEISILARSINKLLDTIERMNKKLYNMASYDSMTGIYNRVTGLEKLEMLFEDVKNRDSKLILAFIDINNLKYVNDHYSHEAGDMMIMDVVEVIESILEDEDIFMRLGGDEFIIGTSRLDLNQFKTLHQELLKKLDIFNRENNRLYKLSLSLGVVEASNKKTLDENINIADIEMYKDKKKNKDR